MGIGEKLARQRDALGLAIENIAAATGMSERQVRAIEASADQFAAPVEMERMIRLYARKVGLAIEAEHTAAATPGVEPQASAALPPIPRFLLKQGESGPSDAQ